MSATAAPDLPTGDINLAGLFDMLVVHLGEFPLLIELADLSCKGINSQYPFSKESTTVLDFGCGTGRIALGVVPNAKRVLGVDISPKAVEFFNTRARKLGYSEAELSAVVGDLKGEEGELGGEKFDVVTCAQTFHHFADLNLYSKILATHLKPGGKLILVDFNRDEQAIAWHGSLLNLNPDTDEYKKVGEPTDEPDTPGPNPSMMHAGGGAAVLHLIPQAGGISQERIKDAFASVDGSNGGPKLEDITWGTTGTFSTVVSGLKRRITLFIASAVRVA